MCEVLKDIHVLRYFSSFISVSNGKIINMTDPTLMFCPLASHLYKGFRKAGTDKEELKRAIREAIESKIRDYGLFTSQRKLSQCDISIPYGASEILMFALNKKVVDAAVVVCDGAGTVVTDKGVIVQGIGARMNNLLLTSPIWNTVSRLKESGCQVVFDNALIQQVIGVRRAIESGYKNIAVTVSGHDAGKLEELRWLESSRGVQITVLVVCTMGVTDAQIDLIRRYADIVWSCSSSEVRQKIGLAALIQVSKQIPLFVLTPKGVRVLESYSDEEAPLRNLDEKKQYLISKDPGERRIRLGNCNNFLHQETLPVAAEKDFAMAKA